MRRPRAAGPYARRAATIEPYDTVLIVCEGTKSEPHYLRGLLKAEQLSSANIAVVPAPGTDPMSIVRRAQESLDRYDRVFCVLDCDGQPGFRSAMGLIAQHPAGRSGKWQAIVSTPCFELWLVLHYRLVTSPIAAARRRSAGAMAVELLQRHFPDYEKGMIDLFDRLSSRVPDAIENGKRLSAHNADNGSSNPATDMHTLVEYLCNLKRR